MSSLQRSAARVVVVLAGLLIFAWLGAGSAEAHATLRGTDPAAGSTVTAVPRAVRLTFTEKILDGTAKVRVTGPAGVAGTGAIATSGTTVAAALSSGLPNGAYTVDWRVTSDDGHPVSGTFAFTLAVTPSSRAASPTTSPSGSPSSQPSPSLDTSPVPVSQPDPPSSRPVIAAVLGTLVAGGGLWFWRSRRN